LRRIERDQPLRQRALSASEVSAGDAEGLPVHAKLALDEPELLVRCLVGAVGPLRGGVELLELPEHGLSLRALRTDAVGARSGCGRAKEACRKQPD
jgi:hypothetical protein